MARGRGLSRRRWLGVGGKNRRKIGEMLPGFDVFDLDSLSEFRDD
jgi:hypothetical protein